MQITTVSGKKLLALLISLLIIALCGIVYELLIGTISSYLLGNKLSVFDNYWFIYVFNGLRSF